RPGQLLVDLALGIATPGEVEEWLRRIATVQVEKVTAVRHIPILTRAAPLCAAGTGTAGRASHPRGVESPRRRRGGGILSRSPSRRRRPSCRRPFRSSPTG